MRFCRANRRSNTRSRGLFISFEGSEGCGKTTQISKLAKVLKKHDQPLVVLREPGGTVLGEEIRHLLRKSEASSNISPEAELLLFAASRAQLVQEKIFPALLSGAVVVCDRYLDSTIVYQCVVRCLPRYFVKFVNQQVVRGCVPDITFLLDIDSKLALQRVAARCVNPPGRRRNLQFYTTVRKGYLALAKADPNRFVVLDAERSAEELSKIIVKTLKERYGALS